MRGESPVFEEFLAARLPALTRYATALAGDPNTGADVLQDVLVKAQPRWSRIAAMDEPEAYVRRMVINELVSARRRIVARLRRESHDPPEPVADGAEQRAERDALMRLIRELPTRQRIVIVLRYFEDLADADIAALLGCSEGTVRSQASRALATLRGIAVPVPLEER
ncbi:MULTISPECIES: SigE family RNA polymerase sigma factor [Dactylosporangium]|uniref:RNA polymerase sigma24 factor n=2 Tax=Dactylosporangium TaxID=35753 RepID=A0A9W6KQG6_9ACTN|nr:MULTISPECIES: SigE family RNA polymerase sigma factor [Dactylosporangium]UAC00887.1 SigE family RNA polymerase sigma factor [Dactylosporangium vinaceum]UWZ48464.1 SigE family RNA polymerase sigma factor [Dactylosporangium matsuzakiense]GLL06271.1 RNA polymerase sigma24 factor [Dactylosporangium matsuzakiense]